MKGEKLMGKSGGSVSEGVEGEIKSGKGRTVDGKVWKGSGILWQLGRISRENTSFGNLELER